MNHHETSQNIWNYQETSRITTNHHENSQITTNLQQSPWNIVSYHETSWIIMNHHKTSWTIMNHPMFWLKLHVLVNISVNSRWICMKPSLSRVNSKRSYWFKESNWRRIFAVPLNQFSQLLKMMKIYTFLTLILYITVQNENIIPTNMCYKIDIFIQNLQEIGASTLSKM